MKKDGGTAFPVFKKKKMLCEVPENGMTLRDYFAGQALSGISAHVVGAKVRNGETHAQACARWSYEQADAMLAARNA